MIGALLVVFVIIDGMVRPNTAPEAAATRALLIAALFVAMAVWVRRSGMRLPWPGAVLAGLLAAYSIAEVYQQCCGRGLSTWLIYAAVYCAQLAARRDWQRDISIAAVGLGALVLLAAPAGPPPGGMLNRNMIAGALVVLSPAVWSYGQGKRRWLAIIITVAALAISGSRGAVVAGLAAALVMWQPWARLGRAWRWMAAPSYATFIAGLVVLRPATFARRFECAAEVMTRWASSPVFGLGPGFEMRLSWGEIAANTHSAYLTPLALAGLVGVMVICVVAGALAGGRLAGARWKWAALAAFAVHALVEENVSWWPVGIVAALVLGSMSINADENKAVSI
jgi:hypothetical protein